ncbi:MAG: hypothetical protein CXX81_07555 [Methanobacteriota archaeon]|nr:MAG: hypothetical protein CXX81_07555 [Euryarchaeota archaeon]
MSGDNPSLDLFDKYEGGQYSKELYELLTKQMVEWLARLRMLEGVPFRYLVPSEEILPNESIRFFHVDRNWLDALVDGALSVGRMGSQESKFDADRYEDLMNDLHNLERDLRPFANDLFADNLGGDALETMGESLTGFLFRSSVVRDFPGIEVSAYDSTLEYQVCSNCGLIAPVDVGEGSTVYCGCGSGVWESPAPGSLGGPETVPVNPYSPTFRIPTLRQERLSETVMMCVFNGTPTHVRIQEPYEGMRLGVDTEQAEWDKPWEPYVINSKDMKADFLCGTCGDGIDTAAEVPTCPSAGSSHAYPSGSQQCTECYLIFSPPTYWFGIPPDMPTACTCGGTFAAVGFDDYRTYDVFTRKEPQDNSVLDIEGIYSFAVKQLVAGGVTPKQDSALLAIQMLQFPYQQDFNCVNQYSDSVNDQPGVGGGS